MGMTLPSLAYHPWVLFLSVRILSLACVRTWFVADEYWQATEIAHHMAFGYGYQTWEWRHGLRSAVYPAVFAGLYKILEILKLDFVFLLIELPRFFHAVAFSVSDYYIWMLSKKLYNEDSAFWTKICLISAWFLEYCAPRTLTSCAETVMSSLALYNYPWRNKRDSCSAGYLWLVGAACVMRPTAAILFFPLCLDHLLRSQYKPRLFAKYVMIIIAVLSISVMVDSWYYGNFIVVPWKFLHFNVLSGLASHYGTHPWHWYLTQGIPVTLATHLLPFLLAVWYHPSRHEDLLPLCCWSIFIYSCLSHKEFRFLLPILPLCHCIGGDYLAHHMSSQRKKTDTSLTCRYVVTIVFLVVPNIVALLYLGLVHQKGPLDVMDLLREDTYKLKNPDILFLMPCHSTPFYSHFHRNVSMRFLTCEPNLKYDIDYLDEADVFEEDPITWLHHEYGLTNDIQMNSNEIKDNKKKLPLPSHILLFDVLLEKVERFLTNNKFYLCHKILNSHVNDGRRSQFIFIYCR